MAVAYQSAAGDFSPTLAPHRELREQFYEVLCLLGAILTVFVVIPANLYQGLPWFTTVAVSLFAVMAAGL